jgi:resuscitation-promoting factor RpfB
LKVNNYLFMSPRTKFITSIGIFVSLILIGLLFLLTWLRKSIELSIDGESQRLTLFALAVADVLRSEDISLAEADLISPAPSHWLKKGDTIAIQRAVQVPVLADGKSYIILTAARTPSNILTQANIPYSAGDTILADGKSVAFDEPLQKDPHTGRFPTLQIRPAISYSFTEDSQGETLTSVASNLGQALWQAGIVLSTADEIEPALSTPLFKGLQAILQRARPVHIIFQGQNLSAMVVASTVGQALSKAGLSMQAQDFSIPTEEAPLPEDGIIHIVSVREESIIEQAPIPFENEYQAAPDLEIDSQKVLQPGEVGTKATRIRIRYEDGQEVSRQVEDEWTARQPQNRIIGYGTNLVEHSADTPDGAVSYWRAIPMYAVSYSPSSAGGSVTASGQSLRKGLVAVDTRYIPLGTHLYIPGYGEAIAADTGGAVKGRVIDLGYSDEDYVAWHQNVTVYFLWPPPGNVVWIFP